MSFFNELGRRNVFRVAAAYVVAAWLVIQVVETLFPVYGLSDASIRIVVAVLVIGLLPVLVFAWAFELTPEGLKKESEVDRSLSITPHTGKKLDRMIMVVLALALGFFAFDKFVIDPRRDAERIEAATEVAVEKAFAEAEAALPERSIAVLPFVDMSREGDQEYFSDGLAEELLNLLASIPELRVISRSSAFSFKDKDLDIPTIAAQLKVRHILEGSVRRDGDQIRITAQLIDAHTDAHLWSETYDRPMQNIFAVQDEISATVVEKMRLTLLGGAPKVKQTSPEAYELFLRARQSSLQGTRESLAKTVELLKQLLEIDPNYAPAWVSLATAYNNQAGKGLLPFAEGYELARKAAHRALEADPENAPALARLGWVSMVFDNDLKTAANYIQQSLLLVPGNSLGQAGSLARALGQLELAVKINKYMADRDPVNSRTFFNLGIYYNVAGQYDEAIASLQRSLELSPGRIVAHHVMGLAHLSKGEAEAALAEMSQEPFEVYRLIGLVVVHHALGQKDESDALFTELLDKFEQDAPYNIAYVLAYRGEIDLAFQWLHRAVELGDPGLSEINGERLFASLHEDLRWLPFLESIGRSPAQLAAIEFEVTLPE